MKHGLAAVLLLFAGAASAKPSGGKKAKTAPTVAASTAAAGTEIPTYAPSTATLTLDLIAARFAELDGKTKSLKATFRQFVRLEGSDTVQMVEGDVKYRKPDLMRLQQTLPEPQTVVSDGTWLWVHRPGTNQVIQTRLESWRKSQPLAKGLLDFGRNADLLKRYAAVLSTVSAPGADGHRSFTVTLTPKPEEKASGDADFKLQLKAGTKDYFPYEAALTVGHASIRSVFENVRLNPEFPDETFRFTPPAGADVFATPNTP